MVNHYRLLNTALRTGLLIGGMLYSAIGMGASHAPDRVREYEVLSSDKRIGSVTASVKYHDDGRFSLHQNVQIQLKSWLEDTHLSTKTLETYSDHSTLMQASSEIRLNDALYWAKLELKEAEYLAVISPVKNEQEKESEQVDSLITSTASTLVPGVGNAIALSQVILDQGKENNHLRFKKNELDTTFLQLPYFWASNRHQLPDQLRIFDLENIDIIPFTVTPLGKKDFKSPLLTGFGYQFKYENEPAIEVWLATDSRQSPVLVQMTGTDENGPYTISLLPDQEAL